MELIDLKSKFYLKCKKYYIKKQKHTFYVDLSFQKYSILKISSCGGKKHSGAKRVFFLKWRDISGIDVLGLGQTWLFIQTEVS